MRDLDRERRCLVALREAADLEQRERARLARVPLRLGRGDLHRLVVGHHDADLAADPEVHRRDRDADDQRELRSVPEELLVPPADEVPAGDAEDHDRRRREPDEQHVDVRPDPEAVREELPDVRQLGAAVGDGRADGPLHPRVGDDDEERRRPASDARRARPSRGGRASRAGPSRRSRARGTSTRA